MSKIFLSLLLFLQANLSLFELYTHRSKNIISLAIDTLDLKDFSNPEEVIWYVASGQNIMVNLKYSERLHYYMLAREMRQFLKVFNININEINPILSYRDIPKREKPLTGIKYYIKEFKDYFNKFKNLFLEKYEEPKKDIIQEKIKNIKDPHTEYHKRLSNDLFFLIGELDIDEAFEEITKKCSNKINSEDLISFILPCDNLKIAKDRFTSRKTILQTLQNDSSLQESLSLLLKEYSIINHHLSAANDELMMSLGTWWDEERGLLKSTLYEGVTNNVGLLFSYGINSMMEDFSVMKLGFSFSDYLNNYLQMSASNSYFNKAYNFVTSQLPAIALFSSWKNNNRQHFDYGEPLVIGQSLGQSLGFFINLNSKYSQFKSITAIGNFFNLHAKRIDIVNKIEAIMTKIVEEKEIYFLEFEIYKKLFSTANFKSAKNAIKRWRIKNSFGLAHIAFSFVSTGYLRYYLNTYLQEYSLFRQSADRFIKCLDVLLAEAKTIEETKGKELCYSIPDVIFYEPKNLPKPYIHLKNYFYPGIKNAIPNSMNFPKNSLIMSPYAAGKTITLTSILRLLLQANMAIVPALEATFTYFNMLIQQIKLYYEFGKGSSKHKTEKLEFQMASKNIEQNSKTIELKKKQIENYTNETKSNKGLIAFFGDELFSGTMPALAANLLEKLVVEKLAQCDNIQFIMCSHFPEMAELTKKSKSLKYPLDLIVLEVIEKNEKFQKTYKLITEDTHESNNWWVNDKEKAKRYAHYENQREEEAVEGQINDFNFEKK